MTLHAGLLEIEWVIVGVLTREGSGGHSFGDLDAAGKFGIMGMANRATDSVGCRMDIRSRAFGRARPFVAYL